MLTIHPAQPTLPDKTIVDKAPSASGFADILFEDMNLAPEDGAVPVQIAGTHEAVAEAMKSTEEKTNALPPSNRLLALIGATKGGLIQLPAGYVPARISVKRSDRERLLEAVGDAGINIGTFRGSKDDEEANFTFVLPDVSHVQKIQKRLQKAGITPLQLSVALSVADKPSFVLKTPDSEPVCLRSVSNDSKKGCIVPFVDKHISSSSIKMKSIALADDLFDDSGAIISAEPSETPSVEFSTKCLTEASYSAAQKEKIRVPHAGPARYLLIDMNVFDDQTQSAQSETAMRKFQKRLQSLASSKGGEFHVTNYHGYLCIISTSARGAGFLGLEAQRLSSILLGLKGRSNIILGKGTVTHVGDEFEINDGLPKINDLRKFMAAEGENPELRSQIFATDQCFRLSTDKTKRDSDAVRVLGQRTSDINFMRIVVEQNVRYRTGGPDKYIGCEEELASVKSFLSPLNRTAKLLVIKGEAGIGKSRLLDEALDKNSIKFAMNAANAKRDGGGLETLADQIDANLQQMPDLWTNEEAAKFLSSENREVDATTLAQMCSDVLILMLRNKKMPYDTIPIDDFHWSDAFSLDPHLLGIVERCIAAGGKVALSTWPESNPEDPTQKLPMPLSLKKLLVRLRSRSKMAVAIVDAAGPNFANDTLAKDYVFHSFPQEWRKGKEVGSWYKQLIAASNGSPFYVTNFMNYLLEGGEEGLSKRTIIDPVTNTINLCPEAKAELDGIQGDGQFEVLMLNRIHSLPSDSQKMLQAIALIGCSASEFHIRRIAERICPQMVGLFDSMQTLDSDSFAQADEKADRVLAQILNPLLGGNFVDVSASSDMVCEGRTLSVAEKLRVLILKTIPGAEKGEMVAALFESVKGDPNFPPSARFGLVSSMEDASIDDYVEAASSSLDEAYERNDWEKVYRISSTVLGNSRVAGAIDVLVSKEIEAGADMKVFKFLADAMASKAEAALNIGKFDEANISYKLLKDIEAKNKALVGREDNSEYSRPDLVDFKRAYILYRNKEAKGYISKFQAILKSRQIDPRTNRKRYKPGDVEMAIAILRFATRSPMFGKFEDLYREYLPLLAEDNKAYRNKHPGRVSPNRIEGMRLGNIQRPYQGLRSELLNPGAPEKTTKHDDDVLLQPGCVTGRHVGDIKTIKDSLVKLQEDCLADNPCALDPNAKIQLIHVRAVLEALEGNYEGTEGSIALFREAMRQSDQLSMSLQTARVAKDMGDVFILKAILDIKKMPEGSEIFAKSSPKKEFDVESILSAIDAYSQGLSALSSTADTSSDYNLFLRVQLIRAVGLLVQSFGNTVPVEKRELLAPQINKALIALNDLSSQFPQLAEDGEVQYYLRYIGDVLSEAETLGSEELNADIWNSPYLDSANRMKGLEFSANIVDEGTREKSRKLQSGVKTDALVRKYRAPQS